MKFWEMWVFSHGNTGQVKTVCYFSKFKQEHLKKYKSGHCYDLKVITLGVVWKMNQRRVHMCVHVYVCVYVCISVCLCFHLSVCMKMENTTETMQMVSKNDTLYGYNGVEE